MKHLKCTILFIYLCGSALAQDKSEYTYQPFIMDGTCEWQSEEWIMGYDIPITNRRVISGEDSVYQGKNYMVIYDYPSCSVKEEDKVYSGLIREEDKRVYYIGSTDSYGVYDTEVLLYDFNLGVGDEVTYPYLSESIKISRIDTILVEGVWRRKFYFNYGIWMEGIGCENYRGITDPLADIPTGSSPLLECVKRGNDVLYKENPEMKCPCDNLNHIFKMSEESRISFYVRDRQLCIHAPNQTFTTLKIYTSDGKLIKSVTLAEQMDEITCSLEEFSPGSYLFIVGSADSQQSGQFIVQ